VPVVSMAVNQDDWWTFTQAFVVDIESLQSEPLAWYVQSV